MAPLVRSRTWTETTTIRTSTRGRPMITSTAPMTSFVVFMARREAHRRMSRQARVRQPRHRHPEHAANGTTPAGGGHILNRTIKRGLVGLGGMVEAADLANELQGGVVQLSVRRRMVRVTQAFDVPTHCFLPCL